MNPALLQLVNKPEKIDKSEILHRLRLIWELYEQAFDAGNPRLAAQLINRYHAVRKLYSQVLTGRKFKPYTYVRPSDLRQYKEPVQPGDSYSTQVEVGI